MTVSLAVMIPMTPNTNKLIATGLIYVDGDFTGKNAGF